MSESVYTGTGYPLPRVAGEKVRGEHNEHHLPERATWPVPWINGDAGMEGDFYSFRSDHQRAEAERLCCVCGDGLHRVVVVAAHNTQRATSGGWLHPKCAALTVRMCPHFRDLSPISVAAWLWIGKGVGLARPAEFAVDDVHPDATEMNREQVYRLAADDPWGQRPWLIPDDLPSERRRTIEAALYG